jgi:hypothetical protein
MENFALEKVLELDFPNGKPFARFQSDGSGHIYYNLPKSPIAVFVDVRKSGPQGFAAAEYNKSSSLLKCSSKNEETLTSTSVYLYDEPRAELLPPSLPKGVKEDKYEDSINNVISKAQMAKAASVKFRSKHLLASFDDHSIGFAMERPEKRPCLFYGCKHRCEDFRVTANNLSKCFTCGHPTSIHMRGKMIMLSQEGGQLTDERGNITNRWLWDSRLQGAGTIPQTVFLRCNGKIALTFSGRNDLIVRVEIDGLSHSFNCGLAHQRKPYTDTSSRGLEKGKLVPLLTNRQSLSSFTDDIVSAAHDARVQLEDAIEHRDGLTGFVPKHNAMNETMNMRIREHSLGEAITRGPLDLSTGGEKMRRETLRATGEFGGGHTGSLRAVSSIGTARERGILATLQEVPVFLRQVTGGGRAISDEDIGSPRPDTGNIKELLNSTLRSLDSTIGSLTQRSTFRAGDSFQDISSSIGDLSGHMTTKDGLGGIAGASMHDGKWLQNADLIRKLQGHHPHSSKSGPLLSASGRFDAWKPMIRAHEDVVFKSLDKITHDGLSHYLSKIARPDQVVLVCFSHPSEGPSRTMLQTLEHVNGTLSKAFSKDPQYHVPVFTTTIGSLANTGASASASAVVSEGNIKQSPSSGAKKAAAKGQKSESGEEVIGSEFCPYRLAYYDMSAASPELIKKYNVRSLPFVLLFFNGKPLYGGPMGGPKIVSLPTNSRIVNVLIADPDAASQQHAERQLRLEKMKFDLACGTFSADAGKIIGTCAAAAATIARNTRNAIESRNRRSDSRDEARAQSASRHKNSSRKGDQDTTDVDRKPLAGTDASAQLMFDYAIILLDAHCGTLTEVESLNQAIGAAANAQRASEGKGPSNLSNNARPVKAGNKELHLVGRSLLTALFPLNQCISGTTMCDLCYSLLRTPFVPSPIKDQEWSCPHCGIIQNASSDTLLGGRVSVAAVKPLRCGALPALASYYRRLIVNYEGGSAVSGIEDLETLLYKSGADPANPITAKAISRAPITGLTSDRKGGVHSDDVHIGLSHNDVIARLLDALKAGRSGQFLGETWKPSLGVSVSETVIRGVKLLQ